MYCIPKHLGMNGDQGMTRINAFPKISQMKQRLTPICFVFSW